MQLYDRGIRRRLAPMLGQRPPPARAGLQPAVLAARHADDAVRRRDRHRRRPVAAGARVRPHADAVDRPSSTAASRSADEVVRPVIDDEAYGYQKVNVADQRRDPNSLLNWMERMIRTRQECPEISWGDYSHPADRSAPEVLVHPLRLARHVAADAPQLRRRQEAPPPEAGRVRLPAAGEPATRGNHHPRRRRRLPH